MKPRLAAVASCVLLAACANYDFARARRADGTLDTSKLIADLQASKEKRLTDGMWIPLIHMDITTFEPSDVSARGPYLRGGYALSHIDAWGPVFLAGSADRILMDGDGATVETADHEWALWGVAYAEHDQQVDTKWGERVDSSHRILLVFGGDSVAYRQPADGAATPAKKAP